MNIDVLVAAGLVLTVVLGWMATEVVALVRLWWEERPERLVAAAAERAARARRKARRAARRARRRQYQREDQREDMVWQVRSPGERVPDQVRREVGLARHREPGVRAEPVRVMSDPRRADRAAAAAARSRARLTTGITDVDTSRQYADRKAV